MAWFDDPTTVITLVVVIASVICMSVIFYAMRLHKRQLAPKPKPTASKVESSLPFRLSKSVQSTTAFNAKDELRILELEREILSDAIRRLYEAQAEGKITEQEREKLAGTYKARMMSIKESIAKDETIVALHDLESMQEDLMKLFSERFGELTSKVEELRSKIDVKPIKEVPIKMPTVQPTTMQMEAASEEAEGKAAVESEGEEQTKKKRKPAEEKPDAKTEAEKRIETIRSEVEKVLDKLGQMEIEG